MAYTKQWKTKGGAKVRVCDMEDGHLVNTIALLERYAKAINTAALTAAQVLCPMIQGEMAELHVDNGIERMEEEGAWKDCVPDIYWDMIEEEATRNEAK